MELKQISEMASLMESYEGQIAKAEKALAELKEKHRKIKEEELPDALKSVGLTEIKLDSGARVSYTQQYFANISEERASAAFAWLRKYKHDALIKGIIALKFDTSDLAKVEREMVSRFLETNDIEFQEKDSVHPQTLKAFVKERIEFEAEVSNKVSQEDKLPRELFGVFIKTVAVVEAPKTK